MGSHPEGFPAGFSAQFQPLTILLGFFPQPVFSSFDWLRFKHSEVVKSVLSNSRCLHFLSLCHFYKKKAFGSGFRGCFWRQSWNFRKTVKEQEDALHLDQPFFLRPHAEPISEAKCVQIKPWGPVENRHPISYNNL